MSFHLLGVFGAGLVTFVTPCVLPLVPAAGWSPCLLVPDGAGAGGPDCKTGGGAP